MNDNLGTIIGFLYPNADPSSDYEVRDDGSGPYIAYWNEAKLGPQPTPQELAAGWRSLAVATKRNEAARRAAEGMKDTFPELHNPQTGNKDDAIWGALEVAFTNAANPRLREMKGYSDQRKRAWALIQTYADDPAKTAEDILALDLEAG